jgi:hypothetical protein
VYNSHRFEQHAFFYKNGENKSEVAEYEHRLRGMLFVPKLSYQRSMLRERDGPNLMFLTYLLCDDTMAIQFMKDVGHVMIRYLPLQVQNSDHL